MKEKTPNSDDKDEGSKPTVEGSDSMKKVKKKGISSKFYYYNKGFHAEETCLKNNMNIMSHFLERHNIEVPGELEKTNEYSVHCHSAQS